MGKRLVLNIRGAYTVILPVAVVLVFALILSLRSASQERAATLMLLYVGMVVALYVFAGNSGILSFGHTSFAVIAAYMSAYLTMSATRLSFILPDLPGPLLRAEFGELPAMLLAALCAALFALVIGIPLVRLEGIAGSVATFALTVVVYNVASYWTTMTGGKASLSIPLTTSFSDAAIWMVCLCAIAYVYQSSRFGLRLRASREDDVASQAIGVKIRRERLFAWVLSGFMFGIAGALYAHFLGAISPDTFWMAFTTLPIAMLIVGGLKSLNGAIFGALIVWLIGEMLRAIEAGVSVGGARIDGPTGLRELGLGALMLLILILRPSGITGGREVRWPWPGPQVKRGVARVLHAKSVGPRPGDESEAVAQSPSEAE